MNRLPTRRFRLERREHETGNLEIDLSRTALIAVDVGGIVNPVTSSRIAPLVRDARKANLQIVYANNSAPRIALDNYEFTRQRNRDSGHYFPEIAAAPDVDPREYFQGDGEWWRFEPAVAPTSGDYVVRKVAYSAFFETPLDMILRSLDARTLICVGFSASECLLATVMDASFRGYRVVVLRDCTSASDGEIDAAHPGSWTQRMIVLMESYLCETATSDEFMRILRHSGKDGDDENL